MVAIIGGFILFCLIAAVVCILLNSVLKIIGIIIIIAAVICVVAKVTGFV